MMGCDRIGEKLPGAEGPGGNLLRRARYAATCYLEHHPGPYHDVYDQLRGVRSAAGDTSLLAAAALYTPVIHIRPPEWTVEREYGGDVFNLLMETTYDPDLSPDRRLAEMDNRLFALSDRARILQMAVLKAYFERDVHLHAGLRPDGDLDYCRWLENHLRRLSDGSPRLARRLARAIVYHLRCRAEGRIDPAGHSPILNRIARLLFRSGR